MKKQLTLSVVLLSTLVSPAQHHGDVWQFGLDASIHFENCTPIVLSDGQNTGFEGCSTISDAAGQLLFYTNSETVWNRVHDPMPNGTLVPSGGTLSQVIIVQLPQSDSLFYVFTTNVQGSATLPFMYHVIDMSLDGGLGDVASANNVLSTLVMAEVVTATTHANGIDAWILCHEYLTDAFMAWQLTPAGILPTPVISHVPPAYPVCASNMNARGELKFSVDGTRLAMSANGIGPNNATNILALFDFDAATGVVSNPLELPYDRGDFGVSFSPDGTKLYGTTWKAFSFTASDTNTVYQFDLVSNDSAIIVASKQILQTSTVSEPFGSLQLAPDGRIYVARQGSGDLGVINSPDLAGPACDYVHNGLYLQGKTCKYGLNNFIQYITCALATDVATGQAGAQPITIGPDPCDATISFHGDAAMKADLLGITIIDASGRELLRMRPNNANTYDVSVLPSGWYLVQLDTRLGRRCSRLVKR